MGHIRLGTLPHTRSWQEVISLLEHGAGVEPIAKATIRAAEEELGKASKDAGVVETVWLLAHLPFAARAEHFEAALLRLGLKVPNEPGLMPLATAFTEAIDARLANNRGRTDFGEMAQMAAVETLVGTLSQKTHGFFDAQPADVRRELGKLHAAKHFGPFAGIFFARVIYKALDYFLSRALAQHAGDGRRFTTLGRQAEFSEALETHCREAAAYARVFSGGFVGKHLAPTGEMSKAQARDFAHGAVKKMLRALKRGAGIHGE
jgi:hypothetical protein